MDASAFCGLAGRFCGQPAGWTGLRARVKTGFFQFSKQSAGDWGNGDSS
jgi:hypothetical protein